MFHMPTVMILQIQQNDLMDVHKAEVGLSNFGVDLVQADLNLEYDMYEAQFQDFLHAVRTGDRSGIRSLFHDAVKTYETSRWITDASLLHNGA